MTKKSKGSDRSDVVHIITTIDRGGAENQLLTLITGQIETGRKVYVVHLKGAADLRLSFQDIGAHVLDEIYGKPILLQILMLRKWLSGRDVLVHAHLSRAELVARLAISNHKFFLSRHNSEPFFPKAPRGVSRILSRFVTARACAVIAISEAVRKFLIASGEVLGSVKIPVIYYGYEPKLQGANLKKDNSSCRIGTVSRLSNQKNLETQLRAMVKILCVIPDAKLLIVGEGRELNSLLKLSKKLKISNNVVFLGRTSDVHEFLSSLDVFILSSRYEGFGLVLLEAMDVGVPIVASNNTAIPEVLGYDFPGLCVTGDPHEFSEKILASFDPIFRQKLLKLQSLRLKRFKTREMVEKIDSTYNG